jgi:hypothetical protein
LFWSPMWKAQHYEAGSINPFLAPLIFIFLFLWNSWATINWCPRGPQLINLPGGLQSAATGYKINYYFVIWIISLEKEKKRHLATRGKCQKRASINYS